ncbi:MAG: DNA repair protein RadC [Saprospiraceae bacterium]|nr:DNA repair protein RadC [Saprospiraceae bacterium]
MRRYEKNSLSIKAWAEEDRPREKLLLKGKHALSDAELLSILLGSGSREETAVGLSQRILGSIEHDLGKLGKMSISELKRFKGIGQTKAVIVHAAIELGRRMRLSKVGKRPQVCSSKDAFGAIAPLLSDLPREEFWILLLNRANRIVAREQISAGGVTGTVVDAKLIFSKAVEKLACSIILCHNHPSGNLQPSQADIDLTQKLKSAGETLDVLVLDHLIVAETGYYSFADEGLI